VGKHISILFLFTPTKDTKKENEGSKPSLNVFY